MKNFLGLPPFWGSGSDEEYVEYVRRLLKVSRAAKVFSLCLAMLWFAMGFGVPLAIIYWMDHPPESIVSWEDTQPGLWLGWFLGSVGGVCIWLGFIPLGIFLNRLNGNRTEKLLLKYFDMIEEKGSADE